MNEKLEAIRALEAERDAKVREQRKRAEQYWDEQQPEWFQEKFQIGKFIQG
jgi:general stress protein 26